jgi:hypothetical protein
MRFHIVAPSPDLPHARVVDELAETLECALRALGHAADITHGGYGSGTSIVLLTTLAEGSFVVPPEGSILYNLEQFHSAAPWFSGAIADALRRHPVWDYSEKNLLRLQAAGYAALGRHVPIGYVPQLTRIAPAKTQDIDVLFYGSMNERRDAVLRTLGKQGLKVFHAFNAYGRARDALIARAKVVLNIHYYPAQIFEMVRVSYLLANRKAVVTEDDGDTDIDDDLRDAVAAVPYASLAGTALRLARDDLARAALEQRAYDRFRARPQASILSQALGELG